jgi:hypothetical protein
MRNRHCLCSPHTLYAGLRLKQFSVAALFEPRVARELKRFVKQDATLSALYLRMGRNGGRRDPEAVMAAMVDERLSAR